MASKTYKKNLYVKMALIALNALVVSAILVDKGPFLLWFLLLLLMLYQINNLVNYLQKGQEEISLFLKSLQFEDYDQTFPLHTQNPVIENLRAEFNAVLLRLKELKEEKDANYQYLKTIVQHAGMGIMTFRADGEVQIMNVEAKRLLNQQQIKNIKELNSFSPALVDCLQRLKTGGRELIKIPYNGSTLPVSIYVIELAMQNEHFKLVSLQNIQSELEEKEMEAWQNMIRILTHEIMNSVTPISSLASTVNDDILRYIQSEEESIYPAKEDLEDIHLAIKTIQRRSEGLIRFVSDFRNLTRIPNPRIKEVQASELISEVVLLLKKDFDENKIEICVNITPEDLEIDCDKELIGQVLINLLQNATHALSDTEDRERKIDITARIGSHGTAEVLISDNGTGIDEEAMSRIFIPFFTTKKQGSGIGLSLSKQIMRKHNGGISVKSEIDIGTEFTLRF